MVVIDVGWEAVVVRAEGAAAYSFILDGGGGRLRASSWVDGITIVAMQSWHRA